MADILILEDEVDLAKQISVQLQQEGHNVHVFNSALAAISHIDENNIDLVIADLFIRSGDKYVADGGIMLISYVRQMTNRQIPAIAISGSFLKPHGEHARTSATTVGATASLAKPFHPDELSALVQEQLKQEKAPPEP